jgi:cell division protease FtsH
MSEKLGYVTFEKEKGPLFLPSPFSSGREYSEDTAKQIDEEVKRIIDESHQKIKEILTVKRDKLEELARFLMEKEVVEEEDLKRILQLEVAKA